MNTADDHHSTARALGFTGHGALLFGYALMVTGHTSTTTAALLAAGAVLAGIGWLRATPDDRLLVKLGGWALLLAPLLALWLYGALWPTQGGGGALSVATESAAWLVLAFNVLVGVGLLRIGARRPPNTLLASVGLLIAAAMILLGVADGGWTVMLFAVVVNAAAQALAAVVFWPPRAHGRRPDKVPRPEPRAS